MKGICCNCGKIRILNHRLICGRCVGLKITEKKYFKPDLKGKVKCVICNYPFPDDKTVCADVCCGCCSEKYNRFCRKEIILGRKGISIKLSQKTKQMDMV